MRKIEHKIFFKKELEYISKSSIFPIIIKINICLWIETHNDANPVGNAF